MGHIKIGDAPHLGGLISTHDFQSCWSSPEAFARHIKNIDKNKSWNKAGWEPGDADFYGTKTMEEALELAARGWREGAEKVKRLRDLIIATNPILKKPVSYGIVGSVPSVPRAVAGNPNNMKQIESAASRRRPVICLVSDMCVSRGVDKDCISNRSAAVATIIDQIEAKGFATEVMSSCCTSNYGKYKASTLVMAKESHHSVDVLRLSFSLGHVAMFRRLVFADWCAQKENAILGCGLGHVSSMKVEDLNDKNYFSIPAATSSVSAKFKDDITTAKEGVPFLIRSLQLQKCPAFPLTTQERERMMKEEEEAAAKKKRNYDFD